MLNKLGKNLENSILNENLKSLLIDQLDILLSFGSIPPIFSTAYKIKGTFDSYQDAILMSKLKAFIFEMDTLNIESREKIISKLNNDSIYGQKAGEFIISAVNRHDFEYKSRLLAIICEFYSKDYFDKNTFIEMKNALEILLVTDLEKICDKYFMPTKHNCNIHLFKTSGLVFEKINIEAIKRNVKFPDRRESKFILTNLSNFGNIFFAVIRRDYNYFEVNR